MNFEKIIILKKGFVDLAFLANHFDKKCKTGILSTKECEISADFSAYQN